MDSIRATYARAVAVRPLMKQLGIRTVHLEGPTYPWEIATNCLREHLGMNAGQLTVGFSAKEDDVTYFWSQDMALFTGDLDPAAIKAAIAGVSPTVRAKLRAILKDFVACNEGMATKLGAEADHYRLQAQTIRDLIGIGNKESDS